MGRHLSAVVLALSCLFGAGAYAQQAKAGGGLRIVASVSDLGAIAREVAGDLGTVEVLAPPTQDPHYVDPKPSLVLALSRADLLILNGMELETGWLPVLITGSRNPKVQRGATGYLDASTLITPKEVPLGKVDRSMGDIHPGGNPHYTKDPRNAAPIAEGVARRLGDLDPQNAARYQQNARAFAARALVQAAEWQKQLAPYRGTPVVTFHKSWIYFVEFAGLTEVAFIEPKPGIPPNPRHVINVLSVIRERKVPLILQEEWYSANTSQTLADRTDAVLVRVPGQAPPGKSYLEGIEAIVRPTLDALQRTRGGGTR